MNISGVLTRFCLVLSGLFGTASATEQYQVADIYSELRRMVLETKPASLGLGPGPNDVWGVVMETGYPTAVVSLVALADGTVSIYFSNGGGILGLGPHPEPARVGKELIAFSRTYASSAQKTESFALPKKAYTRFYFLMGSGVTTIEATEADLGNQRHSLSPLFYKAQELISAIRVVDERRAGK